MRTVGTKLRAEVGEYTGPVKQAQRETRGLVDELADAARKGDLSAKAISKIGPDGAKSMGLAEKAAARLEGQIAETTREVQRLQRELSQTGDVTLAADLDKQLRKLKGQLKVRDSFLPDDSDAEGWASRFGSRVSGALTSGPIHPALVGVLAGAAGAAAPLAGAALAGGVLAGLSGGVVVGGIKLALRDPALKAEAEQFGQVVGDQLGLAARSFIPATRGAMKIVRGEIASLQPDLRRLFDTAAGYVAPLTRGLTSLVREAVPGLVNGLEEAGPVVAALERGLGMVGDAVGDAIDSIGDGSDGAALAIGDLLYVTAQGIRVLGDQVGNLGRLYEGLRVATATDKAAVLADIANGRIEAEQFKNSLQGLVDGIDDTATAAEKAAEEVDALNDAFNDLFGAYMDADQASIALKNGMIDLKEELTDGRRTLDQNTQAGRDNASAVLDQIENVNKLREATYRETGSLGEANAVYDQHIAQLRRTLVQLGYNETQIDDLIGKYRKVPDDVSTKVKLTGAQQAQEAIRRLRREAERFDGSTYTAFARLMVYQTGKPSSVVNESSAKGMRWGGVTEHAQTGLLREAATYSPMGPARYAFAEPATGGEAFIPKRGAYARSMSILDKAASWYGADVVPRWHTAGPSAAGGTVMVRFDFTGVNDDMARALRKMVDVQGGGNVQLAFGRG